MDEVSLTAAIKAAGDEIRQKKASGEDIGPLLPGLQELKRKFQEVTGKPFDPPKEKKKKKEKVEQQAPGGGEGGEMSKNEKKKAEKAAKKAAAKAAHKEAAKGGGAAPAAVAGAAAPPPPPAAAPAAAASSAAAASASAAAPAPGAGKQLCLTGALSGVGGGAEAVAHVDAVKCLAAAELGQQQQQQQGGGGGKAGGTRAAAMVVVAPPDPSAAAMLASAPSLLRGTASIMLGRGSGNGAEGGPAAAVFGANAVSRVLGGSGFEWASDEWLEWEETCLQPSLAALLAAVPILPIVDDTALPSSKQGGGSSKQEYLVDYDEYSQVYQYVNLTTSATPMDEDPPAAGFPSSSSSSSSSSSGAGTAVGSLGGPARAAYASVCGALGKLEAHLAATSSGGGGLQPLLVHTAGPQHLLTVADVAVAATLRYALEVKCLLGAPPAAARRFPATARFVAAVAASPPFAAALAAAKMQNLEAAAAAAASFDLSSLAPPASSASSSSASSVNSPAPVSVSVAPFAGGFTRYLTDVFMAAVAVAFPGFTYTTKQTNIIMKGRRADYQCNACMELFKLLKAAGKAPAGCAKPSDVGNLVVAAVKTLDVSRVLGALSVAPQGFINVDVDPACLLANVQSLVAAGAASPPPISRRRKVAVDFSSPNIAKDMHVGHLRSTIIGDTLCRILEFVGHEVKRLNHVGDWGTQFGMLIVHLKDKMIGSEQPNVQDLTKFYKEAKARFDAEPEFKEAARKTVPLLQGGDPECTKMWKLLCDISRREFDKVYAMLGVVSEERGESFYNSRIPGCIAKLKETPGLVVDYDGAQCVFLTGMTVVSGGPPAGVAAKTVTFSPPKEYDGELSDWRGRPLFLQKTDGGFGYDSTDMTAIRHRVEEMDMDWVVYVTDKRQTEHFHMCFETARRAGWLDVPKSAPPPEKGETVELVKGSGEAVFERRFEHIGFGMVCQKDPETGKVKPFATRAGDTVRLVDLLDESRRLMRASLDERVKEGKSHLSEAELDDAARKIGYGAVKYFDLKQHPATDYVFSYENMLSTQGDTAVYLMFAYARFASIVRKGKVEHGLDTADPAFQEAAAALVAAKGDEALPPLEKEETALALQLAQLPDVLDAVLSDFLPHRVCEYLYELCEKGSKFVTQCFVLDTKRPSVMRSRLLLCAATVTMMRQCFALLGIEPPDRI